MQRKAGSLRSLWSATLAAHWCAERFFLTHHAPVCCEKFVEDVVGQLFLGHRPLQLRRRGAASMGAASMDHAL